MEKTGDVPLSQLVPGQEAIVVRVGGNRQVRRRFMEMGFVKNERVRVERVAPLGDPVAYRIKGYGLSLRKADAELILVHLNNGQTNG